MLRVLALFGVVSVSVQATTFVETQDVSLCMTYEFEAVMKQLGRPVTVEMHGWNALQGYTFTGKDLATSKSFSGSMEGASIEGRDKNEFATANYGTYCWLETKYTHNSRFALVARDADGKNIVEPIRGTHIYNVRVINKGIDYKGGAAYEKSREVELSLPYALKQEAVRILKRHSGDISEIVDENIHEFLFGGGQAKMTFQTGGNTQSLTFYFKESGVLREYSPEFKMTVDSERIVFFEPGVNESLYAYCVEDENGAKLLTKKGTKSFEFVGH